MTAATEPGKGHDIMMVWCSLVAHLVVRECCGYEMKMFSVQVPSFSASASVSGGPGAGGGPDCCLIFGGKRGVFRADSSRTRGSHPN